MEIKKYTVLCIMIICFVSLASATVLIDVQDSFSVGENMMFTYTIQADGYVEYVVRVDCPQASIPLIGLFNATIDGSQTFTYDNGVVDASLEPQACTAIVSVISPIKETASQTFTIENDKTLPLTILSCPKQDCITQQAVFVVYEQVYLATQTNVADVITSAVLTYPDKTTSSLTLPTHLTLNQIGTYELKVTASKEGYKQLQETITFEALSRKPRFVSQSICDGDNLCSDGEDYLNCPQDCRRGEAINKASQNVQSEQAQGVLRRLISRFTGNVVQTSNNQSYRNNIFIYVLIVILFALFLFIAYKRLTKEKKVFTKKPIQKRNKT